MPSTCGVSWDDTLSDEFADDIEWENGMLVEWRAIDAVGRIVHVPEDQHILMVDVVEQVDGEWESTGYTLTAGYQDVVPMEGDTDRQMADEGFQVSADADAQFGVNVEFASAPQSQLGDGFNEYGVRENPDGSVDVRFEAMEPGERRGVEITPSILQNVVSHQNGKIPVQLDHSESQRANVGYLDPDYLSFDGKLQLQAHVPNTGSSVRDDVIADFTHEPPQIKDISVSFDPRTMKVSSPDKRGENPEFVDGKLREVSLTPFPAGYDNGGLTPAFSSAVEDAVVEEEYTESATSQLAKKPHTLIRN
jgi:hypothetical protein